jgi:hypothetical protein
MKHIHVVRDSSVIPVPYGKVLCQRVPQVDDDLLYVVVPVYEDVLGRPEWSRAMGDVVVSEKKMLEIRQARGLIGGAGINGHDGSL